MNRAPGIKQKQCQGIIKDCGRNGLCFALQIRRKPLFSCVPGTFLQPIPKHWELHLQTADAAVFTTVNNGQKMLRVEEFYLLN